MSSFSSERPLDVSGTRVLLGIGTALPGSLLLSISCEGDSVGWWDAATGAVLILLAVILLVRAALRKAVRRQALWGLLFVVYGILGALLVPSGLSRFFTVCVWVNLMNFVWLTLRQRVRI
ncbi:hypothetical protein Q0N65_03860 [Corynebacterium tuberculostearicum]|uniref:hypothetical protein n=1 Tax=Corynebacterium tuberculostearicum TaxID=38304 RepID=UPI00265604AB|nr:hypothetical protein [Corynebacterium tuberculostearicum]MDN8596404.1 hypothetical protein [Corynebacterium tuberculostearicum]